MDKLQGLYNPALFSIRFYRVTKRAMTKVAFFYKTEIGVQDIIKKIGDILGAEPEIIIE